MIELDVLDTAIQEPMIERSQNSSFLEPPRCEFPFDGDLRGFLRQSLDEDIQSSVLSKTFQYYYRIRKWVPKRIRNLLQRARNCHRNVGDHWYIPQALESFLETLDQPVASIWPKEARYAFLLTHDVEESDGFQRILEVADEEERFGFRSCWNLVPYKYRIDMGVVTELKNRGHEIAVHGFNHDGRLFSNKKTFDARVPKINEAAIRFDATGFRAPMVHRNFPWMQSLHFEYDSSCFDVDPFQAIPGGVQNIWPFRYGRLIEIPYTLPQDHTLFVTLKENSTRIWQDKLRFIRKHHGMAVMLTHPDYLHSTRVMCYYRQFLSEVREASEAWHVLPGKLARWFASEVLGSQTFPSSESKKSP